MTVSQHLSYGVSLPETDKFVLSVNQPVSGLTAEGTISSLDAGGWVYDSNLEMWVWKSWSYYFKEYESAYDNTDPARAASKSYNSLYKGEYFYDSDKPFVLQNGYQLAELKQGIRNRLQKTKHEVELFWDDQNNESGSRDNYSIMLWRRTGSQGWTQVDLRTVDLTNVETETVETDGESRVIKRFSAVLLASSQPVNHYKVPYNPDKPEKRLHYCFDGLPVYDENGLEYTYRVTESAISVNDVSEAQTFLFHVPGSLATDEESSYVRAIRRGTPNYYVDYAGTTYDALFESESRTGVDPRLTNAYLKSRYLYETGEEDGTVYQAGAEDEQAEAFTHSIIINTLMPDIVSFRNYEAEKVWDDRNNLYGKRPDEIVYTLKRTKTLNGVTTQDTEFSSVKIGDESNQWKVRWSELAAFARDGSAYSYYITEDAVDYYIQEDIRSEKADTLVYRFTNTYVPELRDVTAYKKWDDKSDRFGLRPQNIQFRLFCRYDIREKNVTTENHVTQVTVTTTGEYDGPAKAEDSAVKDYLQTDTLSLSEATPDGADANSWKVTFSGLPAYVNTCGDETFCGEASLVTYYVKEIVDDQTVAVYECGNQADSRTSDEKTLQLYARKGSITASASNGTVTLLKQSFVRSGKLTALLENLPKEDIYGNAYEYSVREVDSQGTESASTGLALTESSFHDQSGNTAAYVLTKELPRVSFRILRRVGSDGTDQVVTRNDMDSRRLTLTANGITYAADSNGIFTLPKEYSGTDCLNAVTVRLPKKDAAGNLYLYSVQECDVNGTAVSAGSSDTMSLTAADDGTGQILTVRKPLGTEEPSVRFRVYRRARIETVSGEPPETSVSYGAEEGPLDAVCFETPVRAEKNTRFYPVNSDNCLVISKALTDNDNTSGDNLVVSVPGLPAANGSGQEYTHFVREYAEDGTVISPSELSSSAYADSGSPDTVSLTVSAPVPRICFRLYRRAGENGTPVVMTSLGDDSLKAFVKGVGISADTATGIMAIPQSYATGEQLFVSIIDLPKHQDADTPYYYAVQECDSAGNPVAVTEYMLPEGNEEAVGSVSVTRTIVPDIRFRVFRQVEGGTEEEVYKIVSDPVTLTVSSFMVSTALPEGDDVLIGAGNNSVSVTNTLATRDILVTKDWNDHYYGKEQTEGDTDPTSAVSRKLHYKTAIRLDSPDLTVENAPYSEIRILSSADSDRSLGVVFRDLPIFKLVNGNPEVVRYTVTEYRDPAALRLPELVPFPEKTVAENTMFC